MKIVFFGTPDFASHTLARMAEHNLDVVGVVTPPDRPRGRGHKLQPCSVKETAMHLLPEVPILQPESLKDVDFIHQLKSLEADLFIVIAFRMLPKEVWAMPRLGTFNLHASLLPDYRGAAPIQHAIMQGEEETGVTTFFLNEEIDEGHILLQRKVPITSEETGGSLHDKLMEVGADLVLETIDLLDREGSDVQQSPQQVEARNLHYATKIFKEDRLLAFHSATAKELELKVRAMSPYPATIGVMQAEGEQPIEMKIYRARILPDIVGLRSGEAEVTKESIKVQCREGALEILELQYPNKRRMETTAFLLGNPLQDKSIYFQ